MSTLVDALTSFVGANAVLTGSDIGPAHQTDWTRAQPAVPIAVVLPLSTGEVSAILKLCHEARQTVVPQGGMTGLAGGAIPRPGDICLSLSRMTGIESVDPASATMTVRAGATLQAVQEAAATAGLEFPLDMGSRGSCQIGGVIATNAGGLRVVRSGAARDQVLGLEVVLADGTILDSMSQTIKNNTGYDLKHWFIGSEGTLGIVTRAVLRLRAKTAGRHTALCALNSYDAAIRLLGALRGDLSAFEIMWEDFFDFATAHSPFSRQYPLYALIETTADPAAGLTGIADDAVFAYSAAEIRALWEIRESTAAFPHRLDPLNFDVGLPIARLGQFAAECKRVFESHWPGHRSFFFGHIGDSNLHVTVDAKSIPSIAPEEVDRVIYSLVAQYKGSISAEHGIGLLKREFLYCSRTQAEIETMWAIKKAIDPRGILNPGKVLPNLRTGRA